MKKTLIGLIVTIALVVGGISAYAVQKGNMGRFKNSFGLTEEQKEILTGKIKTALDEMLAAEEITNEQYESLTSAVEKGFFTDIRNGGMIGEKTDKMPELTDEQKAEMLEKHKERLSEQLGKGEITQEQYDEILSGKNKERKMPGGRGFQGGNKSDLKTFKQNQ